jgi:hypothetical protein
MHAHIRLFLVRAGFLGGLFLVCAGSSCPGRTSTSDAGTSSGVLPSEECTRDSDCLSGHCPTLASEPRACRSECRADGTCEEGFACTLTNGARLCLPLQETRAAGNRCQRSRQCASGTCASVRAEDAGVCVEQCQGEVQCPTNLACAVDGTISSRPFCTPPLDALRDGVDCTNGRECAGGRCVSWGGRLQCAPGCASCNLDGGSVCLPQDPNGQACVSLLGTSERCGAPMQCVSGQCLGWDGGGVCVGPCGLDQLCPTGSACVLPQGATDKACVPLDDSRTPGAECTSPTQCLSGRCARFGTADFDGGVLCADPCADGGCPVGQVCWGQEADAGLRGLCGPRPF